VALLAYTVGDRGYRTVEKVADPSHVAKPIFHDLLPAIMPDPSVFRFLFTPRIVILRLGPPINPTMNKILLTLTAGLFCIAVTLEAAEDIKIKYAMAAGKDSKPATSFASDTPMICVFFEAAGTKKGDTLRSVWTAVDVGDAAPANTKLDEATVTCDRDNYSNVFTCSVPKGWPVGDYKVEIYNNDKLVAAPEFAITPAGSSFAGTWDTDWGSLTLRQDGTNVIGEYSGQFTGTIEGTVVDGSLKYTWKQTNGEQGSGVFRLADDGNSIRGTWGTKDSADGGEWTGRRASAE
jgi:hypothetical protein